MMRKRCRIIYNPTSGREALRNDLVSILNILENAGYETSAYATTPEPNSAKNEAMRACQAGFSLIVAAGGDGTINEVVNGIAPQKHRPKLGIIPAGTTNDYARALRIPREDPLAAAKVIASGQSAKIDIGKANDNYFVNIAAGGSLTELTYGVSSQLKSLFGYVAYLVKGAELLPQIRPMAMKFTYDGGEYEGLASMFFLALTNSVGGLEQIVPDATLNDGKFTLIVVKTSNVAEILQLIRMVLMGGRHVNDPRILYVKTNKVKVKPANSAETKRLMINIDGEYGGDAPMTFKNLKQHLEIFTPIKPGQPQLTDTTEAEQDAKHNFMEEMTGLDSHQPTK